jgi:hypothetical protein
MELTPGEWPQAGDVMFFTGKGGYDVQRHHAEKFFTVGKPMVVVECRVGRGDHSIIFEGVQGSWNGCMFAHVPGERADEVEAIRGPSPFK